MSPKATVKLLVLVAALPLIACGGATFEAGGKSDAGASGDDGVAGATESGGSSGAPSAGAPSVAGKPAAGHAGKGGAGGSSAAGAAGSEPRAGAESGGSGGGTTAGAGGSSGATPVGGSAGTDAGMAGAAGAVEVPPDPPSCTVGQAFAKAEAPDAFLLPAWSSTNDSDHVCWEGADRVCTFTLGEWSFADGTGHLSVKEITCDKPLYFGTPKDGVCTDQVDCQIFKGSVADLAVVEFGLEPSDDGYAAADLRVKAAGSSGGLVACDLNASTLTDELRAAVVDMISSVSFSCGAT